MRKIVIIGNWKMNMTKIQAQEFLNVFQNLIKEQGKNMIKNLEFGLAIPNVLFDFVNEIKNSSKYLKDLIISSQNFLAKDFGAYTGEINAPMLLDSKIHYSIVGHSERRSYFGEIDQDVNQKALVAIENNITPIICFGETEEEFEKGITTKVVQKQLTIALKGVDLAKVILAYEPIWAIGTGKTATTKQAQEMAKYVRSITNKDVILQYGGSVKPGNIAKIIAMPDIDGALVGGASLDAKSFFKLLTLNK